MSCSYIQSVSDKLDVARGLLSLFILFAIHIKLINARSMKCETGAVLAKCIL